MATALGAVGLLVVGAWAPGGTASADMLPVILSEELIEGPGPGVRLYLREKRPERKQGFADNEVVLFLEPFGVPTAEAFDVPGYSWMEVLAGLGFDAWALDFHGFGRSTRPPAMERPPMENRPVVRAADAVRDVVAAVRHITKSRGVTRVSIVGWSWGAVVAAMYAIEQPGTVARLVLYGAMHAFNLPSMTAPLEEKPGVLKGSLPAYQLATFEMTLHHWRMMLGQRPLVTDDALRAVREVFMRSDPTSGARVPPAIRRPMGPLVDLHHVWSARPIFDAARITVPVLVIRGDADFFAEPGLAAKFTRAPRKEEVVIKDATHWVLYEKHRDRLWSATEEFLKR